MEVEQAVGQFENGGTAVIDQDSNLKLDLLTPGDKASFTVKIDNNSNVTIQYRIVFSIEGELAAGSDILNVTVEVELPVEAVNAYQEHYTSIVVLEGCTRINCSTATQGAGQLTIK